jgi:hypothetical protein
VPGTRRNCGPFNAKRQRSSGFPRAAFSSPRVSLLLRLSWHRTPSLVALVAVVGCAGRTKRTDACQPVPEDQWIGGTPVFRDCSVDRVARPSGPTARVQFTPSTAQYCVRAIIDVVVDDSGRPIPSSARTVRSNDHAYLQAVIASLDARRYEPAQLDGRNVPQIVRIDVAMAARTARVVAGSPMPQAPRRPSC